MKTAIVGATLIDGTGAAPMPDAAVMVDGDQVFAVDSRSRFAVPADVARVEASGKFLLPGLIELHTHFFHPAMVTGPGGPVSPAYGALIGHNNLRQALQAGITTIRDVIADNYIDMAFKRAIAEGIVIGPRIFASGKGLSMTGGHGGDMESSIRIANGVVDVRNAVREQVRMGADWIKVLTSHRGQTCEYTQEELSAAADEAHRLGKLCAVHAASYPSTRMSAIAGFDTIEHGSFMDDETIAMMIDKGITWVPTCVAKNITIPWLEQLRANPDRPTFGEADLDESLAWFRGCVAELPNVFRRALRAGLRIGAGTDVVFGNYPFAALPEELEHMVSYGLTPMQAIESATRVGAETLRQQHRFGTVQPGKYADLILVERDPLADITALKKVSWVMKAGRVVPFAPEYDRLAGQMPWRSV